MEIVFGSGRRIVVFADVDIEALSRVVRSLSGDDFDSLKCPGMVGGRASRHAQLCGVHDYAESAVVSALWAPLSDSFYSA